VFGSVAETMTKKNEHEHTHQWTVYVRGINNEDISYYVKKVQFKLHESFAQPNRGNRGERGRTANVLALLFIYLFLEMPVVEQFPFEVTETGWGEFDIQIKLTFQDTAEKPIVLYHHLRLYATQDTVTKGNAIISEYYDEIVRGLTFSFVAFNRSPTKVFNEPTEFMYDILVKNRALSVPSKKSESYQHRIFFNEQDNTKFLVFSDAQIEKAEVSKLSDARLTIQNSIKRLRKQYEQSDEHFLRLQKEVTELENRQKAQHPVQ